MDQTAYLLGIINCLLVEWEVVIITFIAFCTIAAIPLGVVWLFLRKDLSLFIVRCWNKLLEV